MSGVLVDTSVWVDHFRHGNAVLVAALERDRVLCHPFVLGEIACGTPPQRAQTLADLGSLRSAQQATVGEVMAFVQRERLYGAGCGLVDLVLLASALQTPGAVLWTMDRRLAVLAQRFGVHFDAPHPADL